MMENTSRIAHRLMELTLDELNTARDWMVLLGRKTAREKIATFIAMLVLRSDVQPGQSDVRQIGLPMTRDQRANSLGLTLETVSRQMNGLKKDGNLSFPERHRIAVVDLSRVLAATGGDLGIE